MRDTTHASRTAANRSDARGKNCGSYCGAHRLPAGRTAAKEESKRASCRSGRKTIRRSTTATVQGICPFRGNTRILVTMHKRSQRLLGRFFFRICYLRGMRIILDTSVVLTSAVTAEPSVVTSDLGTLVCRYCVLIGCAGHFEGFWRAEMRHTPATRSGRNARHRSCQARAAHAMSSSGRQVC